VRPTGVEYVVRVRCRGGLKRSVGLFLVLCCVISSSVDVEAMAHPPSTYTMRQRVGQPVADFPYEQTFSAQLQPISVGQSTTWPQDLVAGPMHPDVQRQHEVTSTYAF
jgi:hypothetical protein